jgi:hypothetical protein
MLRHFSPETRALLTDLTEASPFSRTEMAVKSPNGGNLIPLLVNYVATLDFVSQDFVRRFFLQTHKSKVKMRVRLANGQRVASSSVCDISFELARHEFQRDFSFYVIYAVLLWCSVYRGWTKSHFHYSSARRVFSCHKLIKSRNTCRGSPSRVSFIVIDQCLEAHAQDAP